MRALLDTCVLGRLANADDAQHALASSAVMALHRQGYVLSLAPQVLIEFRAFSTRPRSANGLGLSPAAAATLSRTYEEAFPLLEETAAIYPAWKAIVDGLGVSGRKVHDARLVATCHVFSIPRLVTFNLPDFTRLVSFGPRVEVVDPARL